MVHMVHILNGLIKYTGRVMSLRPARSVRRSRLQAIAAPANAAEKRKKIGAAKQARPHHPAGSTARPSRRPAPAAPEQTRCSTRCIAEAVDLLRRHYSRPTVVL